MVPDVAAPWPVFGDDAAKTRLHDANSDWMEFSERTDVAQLPPRQKFSAVTGDDEGLAGASRDRGASFA
jgi:hypothetical protein